MTAASLASLILEYRYWILVPLSIVEGPVVAFVAGTLAAAGYFSIYFLAVFFFIRDIGLDGVYYAIGHFGGKTRFVKRMLEKVGIAEDHLGKVRELWERRPGLTMLIGKISWGIASSFIVVAGTVGMSLSKFFGWGAVVAVLQYGTLLFLGYYLGTSAGSSATEVIKNIGYIVAFSSIVIAMYYISSFRARRKFLEGEQAPPSEESH